MANRPLFLRTWSGAVHVRERESGMLVKAGAVQLHVANGSCESGSMVTSAVTIGSVDHGKNDK